MFEYIVVSQKKKAHWLYNTGASYSKVYHNLLRLQT